MKYSKKNFHKEIYIDMDENGISSLKIKTNALGPCMCYLLTFEHKNKSQWHILLIVRIMTM